MERNDFITICKLSQKKLKKVMTATLSSVYPEVIAEDGYVYAKGNIPILLTAHMDTVHKEQCKKVKGRNVLWAKEGIGGDDRCGIYMALEIIERLGKEMRPSILFCEDEEIGGIGSNKFVKSKHIDDLKEMLFLVEMDRANKDDLVFYDDDNQEFHRWCEQVTGYKETWGSFSDISHLCPACKVSGVNISCGYYKAHTTEEYVVFDEMETSIEKVVELVKEGVKANKQYEYVEFSYYNYGKKYSPLYEDYFDYCEYLFVTESGIQYEGYGTSYEEAVGRVLLDNPNLKFNDFVEEYQVA